MSLSICWGLGANAVGRYFPYDRETCHGHGGIVRRSDVPLYFEGDRVLCGDCATRRHEGCPCGSPA